MGFLDSLKTGLARVGEGIGAAFEFAAPIFGPPLIEAGVRALNQAVGNVPQQQFPVGPFGVPVFGGGGGQFPTRTFALPGGAMVPASPAGARFGFTTPTQSTARRFATPSPSPIPFGAGARPAAGRGGFSLAAFPETRDPFSFPIPFTGLEISPDLPFVDISPRSRGGAVGIPQAPFRPSMAGATAQKFVATNPVTGAAMWFGPLGKPLLFSRDFAVVRRVNRIASRARRVRGRR